ncbi:MAG: phosphotransferase, partial [Pseudomonadota bacterium]
TTLFRSIQIFHQYRLLHQARARPLPVLSRLGDGDKYGQRTSSIAHTHVWTDAFGHLRTHTPGLCLRDFHAQNLFWLPERDGQARVGLIDFQDALFAHPAYDLASLLEDARRDVDPELRAPMLQRFCDKAGLKYDAAFEAAYSVTAAQRNAKILGIFVRLAERDGKPRYRSLIPRVKAHFQRDLAHPACAELRGWFDTHVPEALQ